VAHVCSGDPPGPLVIIAANKREKLITPVLVVGPLGVAGRPDHRFPGNFTLESVEFPHTISRCGPTNAPTHSEATRSRSPSPGTRLSRLPDHRHHLGRRACPILNGYTGMGNKNSPTISDLIYGGQVCPPGPTYSMFSNTVR